MLKLLLATQVLLSLADTVSVSIIGDVMMHTKQLEHPMETFLANIKPALSESDLAVANMEFSLAGEPYTGYPAFSAPDKYAQYAADCGVDIFLTANNHLLDKGHKGAKRTLDIYSQMNVPFVGSGRDSSEISRNKPLILKRKGIKLAFVNFSYGSNYPQGKGWPRIYDDKPANLASEMTEAEEKADFTIVLPHWGTEYQTHHSEAQEKLALKLVEMGADVIVGAHPHVVQDSTHINGVPVFYSIGNAVSNMSAKNTRLELMVILKFVNEYGRKKMLEPEVKWMWCTLPGTLTHSYSTIFIEEWKGRRNAWKSPADYDNMIATQERMIIETGIK